MKARNTKTTKIGIESLFQRQNIWMVICTLSIIFLTVYYGSYVSSITTVWELPDEFGYLANAEFLAKNNWPQHITAYYGYGYSLLLVPLFYICKSGVGLIQGAVIVNIICVIFTYVISFCLMCKLCQTVEKWKLAFVAFVLCLYPYITANTLKVNCECFLTMLTWLAWFLFYECIEKKNKKTYVILGLVLVCVFFTHTRGLALVLAMSLLLFMMLVGKDKTVDFRMVLLCMGALVVFGIAGYILKEVIVTEIYTGSVGATAEEEIVNIINLDWILTRLRWIFSSDFVLYVYSLLCKVFYIGVASLGLAYGALFEGVRRIKQMINKKDSLSSANWVEIGIVISFVLMILMVLASGAGRVDLVAYFYYGRYYEFMICPLIFIGVKYFMEKGMKIEDFLAMLVVWGLSAAGCILLSNHITNSAIRLDTGRIAAFSFITQDIQDYAGVLEKLMLYSGFGMVLVFVCGIRKNIRPMVLIPVFVLFMANNSAGIEAILQSNTTALGDNRIADFLAQDYEQDSVYFVKTNYKYEGFHTRMQVLLNETQLEVVDVQDVEDIPTGAYFIGYNTNNGDAQVSGMSELVMEGTVFNLYQMN